MTTWTFEGGQWIVGPNGERIAQIQNYTPNYLAKGNLIANAPDLLEALEDLYHQASQLCDSCGSWMELEQAKQAIETTKEE